MPCKLSLFVKQVIYIMHIVPLEEKRRMVLKEKLNLATYIFINQNIANVNVSKRWGLIWISVYFNTNGSLSYAVVTALNFQKYFDIYYISIGLILLPDMKNTDC